ncbi:VOC family protein [Chitinophaga tropicalis]|uniref:VOC family protein n=1 Tax=Chitinophaga tropicalis TaxID=2683588 RepID=A0A7K1UBY0_9BACT|nr:VOC family protein [Chitinophaga tropicalis]MVT11894.1 VOC family protein [Chitinophaga tropicalis]
MHQVPKNALSWFEIPVHDFDRARKFYSQIFSYEMPEQQLGFKRMGFFPCDNENGGIGGAIVQGSDYLPSQRGSLIYLYAGDDLTTVLDRVEDAGGKIELDKRPMSELQDLGYFAIIFDTDGNRVALYSKA